MKISSPFRLLVLVAFLLVASFSVVRAQVAPLTISSIVPSSAQTGTTVVINGSGFNSATYVDVIGTNLAIRPFSQTSVSLKFTLPSSLGAGTYQIRLIEKAGEGFSNSVSFTVVASNSSPFNDGTNNNNEIRSGENRVENRLNEFDRTQDDRIKALQERHIRVFAEKARARLLAAFDRIELFVERIESRLIKFELIGIDTTKSRVLLKGVAETVEEGRATLVDFDLQVEEIINGEISLRNVSDLRGVIKNIIVYIKDAHSGLIQTIDSMEL
jgi:hypothetical protein